MKEIVAHILEIAVVVIALIAIIAIVSSMTKIGTAADGSDSGYITNSVQDTIESVFDKTNEAIGSAEGGEEAGGGETH